MKNGLWIVESITSDSANILMDDDSIIHHSGLDAVGIGLPPALAQRIVKLHNAALVGLYGSSTQEHE